MERWCPPSYGRAIENLLVIKLGTLPGIKTSSVESCVALWSFGRGHDSGHLEVKQPDGEKLTITIDILPPVDFCLLPS